MTSDSGNSTNGVDRKTVDTNIVVYAHDPADQRKQKIARELLRTLSDGGQLTYSVQVFNEFGFVMSRSRGRKPLAADRIAEILHGLAVTGDVVPITPTMTFMALRAIPIHGFSFWDALIWAAAKENGVGTIYTEDFQHGRAIEGVLFVDPFADES